MNLFRQATHYRPIMHRARLFSTLPTIRQIQSFNNGKLLDLHPEVRSALNNGLPVVALESTIITHGMPYPHNINTAIEVEEVVRSQGATPATVAILKGRLKVGLSRHELQVLANSHSNALKCSRCDLPYAAATGQNCGTTVAATIVAANMAGIRVFATGGIGGVHRNGHITMDISADLIELGKTPLAVISSGIKSILDIPRTLEYLETQGVCVTTYGNADGNFPDFYTRSSGCKVPYNVRGPKEAARLINALKELQINSGILIAVPIPEEYAADKSLLTAAINAATAEAERKGLKGKEVTPFLLSAVAKITHGKSLHSNIALIKNNATVAAQIAKELCLLNGVDAPKVTDKLNKTNKKHGKPLIIGAAMLDLSSTLTDEHPLALNGATYTTRLKCSAGGVGRNLAEGIYKLYGKANLISVVGDDYAGHQLLHLMPEPLHEYIQIEPDEATATCSVVLDRNGDCKICLANAQINEQLTPKVVQKHTVQFEEAPLIIMDANLNISTIESVLKLAATYDKAVFYEPTDFLKAAKPFQLDDSLTRQIRFISPNMFELRAIAEHFIGMSNVPHFSMDLSREDILKCCRELLLALETNFDCILVTLGKHGVIVSLASSDFSVPLFNRESGIFETPTRAQHCRRFYEAPLVTEIVNVSGAGDSFNSGFITGVLHGLSVDQSVALGFFAASRALRSPSAVPQIYFESTAEKDSFLCEAEKSVKVRNL